MVKIVVAGGSGQVAREVVDALLASGKHDITVFSRDPTPTAVSTPGVKWQAVDYHDKEALVEALLGIHTILSFVQLLSDPGQEAQKNLIDAAIGAGVKRFAPSDRGTDNMAWWEGKRRVREYLREVNEPELVIEYTLFQPGLFLDYLAFPHKTSKYVEPLQTVFDFENRRALVVDGHEDAIMTLTTVADTAAIIARAVEYEGRWPTTGGIRGNRVPISQILEIGRPFAVEKVKGEDLEVGELKASWGLEAVHRAVADDQAQALLKAVCIGTLLSSSKGAWDSSDEMNRLFPDYQFTPIETFLSKPAALATPQLSVKVVWSRSLKSAEETARLLADGGTQAEVYSSESGPGKSYDELLKREDISGLVLALPIVDQPSYIEKALAAGKHVLAEKPIAKDLDTALKLIDYYKKISIETKATLSIAENFRFMKGWAYAAEEIKKLGRVTGFVVRLHSMMQTNNKYYNTPWRTKPEHQGGFLLDGGVHYTAALRELLGKEDAVASVIALTSLVNSHLPPKDTINAILQTKSGVLGSYIHSVGSAFKAFDFHVACEHGYVEAGPDKVVTVRGIGADAKTEEKTFGKGPGVKEEVQAWAETLRSGNPYPEQTPELALGDLELLEKMLTSGDKEGARQQLEYQ
ncbi:hypothetical protein NUW58_g4009 [Xylaria curta]|uniref:Uncharacterized protein n=1 Tax=Xylaria curta TaxID=42375 RepID=A0ACC1P8A8_9PEZI|nr:hypothetical protein NUW58_g4009 [Xylaria curta]